MFKCKIPIEEFLKLCNNLFECTIKKFNDTYIVSYSKSVKYFTLLEIDRIHETIDLKPTTLRYEKFFKWIVTSNLLE